MDSYLSSNHNRANSFDAAPLLIISDTHEGRARAAATAAMSGIRVADAVGLEDATHRIPRQIAASALWVELDAPNPAIEHVLEVVAGDVGEARHPAVISVPESLVEHIEAHALNPDIDVIIGADQVARTVALALAIAKARSYEVNEASADKSAVRLRQLSDEVSRIAATLARLSTGPTDTSRRPEFNPRSEAPEVSLETVKSVIRARQLRSRYFPENLFADPAWDMLLDLLQAEITKLRVPVSSLCIAAAVPATTALRWLKTMVQEGIFIRQADPHDGRRVFVELAPETSHALRRYFAEIGTVSVI